MPRTAPPISSETTRRSGGNDPLAVAVAHRHRNIKAPIAAAPTLDIGHHVPNLIELLDKERLKKRTEVQSCSAPALVITLGAMSVVPAPSPRAQKSAMKQEVAADGAGGRVRSPPPPKRASVVDADSEHEALPEETLEWIRHINHKGDDGRVNFIVHGKPFKVRRSREPRPCFFHFCDWRLSPPARGVCGGRAFFFQGGAAQVAAAAA